MDSPVDANAVVTVWASLIKKTRLQLLQMCKARLAFPCLMYTWRRNNWLTADEIYAVMFLWHKLLNVRWEDQVALGEFFLLFFFPHLLFTEQTTVRKGFIAGASISSVIALLSWVSTELFYVCSISAEAIVCQSWRQDKKCLWWWDLWSTRKWHNRP